MTLQAWLIPDALSLDYWLSNPWIAVVTLFQLWMFVDAVRRREWYWAVFIFIGFGLAAILYFFFVYRESLSATRGFELPGAHDRRRIKHLQAQIHHLDKAHHHLQLADIYFQQGKLQKAEGSYRAAMERDSEDLDTRAHLGQCLLRQGRASEALPLLEGVVAANPRHEYGYSMMALAEAQAAAGLTEAALGTLRQVTQEHSYPRAKVQLAELYLQRGEHPLARTELQDVVADDAHAPAFQRKRDRVWVRKARSLMRRIPA